MIAQSSHWGSPKYSVKHLATRREGESYHNTVIDTDKACIEQVHHKLSYIQTKW